MSHCATRAPGRWFVHDVPHLPDLLRALRVYHLFERPIARRVDLLLRCLSLSAPDLVRAEQVSLLVRLACCPWQEHPSGWRGGALSSLLWHVLGTDVLPHPHDPALARNLAQMNGLSYALGERTDSARAFAPLAAWPGGSWRVGVFEWSLSQLLTKRELTFEGRALSHCVANDWRRALAGHVSLWSLKRGRQRMLTIEVENAQRAVIRVRGKRNRSPNQEETAIIARWVSEQGLVVQSGVLPRGNQVRRSDT